MQLLQKNKYDNVAPATADMETNIANAVSIKDKSGIKDVPSRTAIDYFRDKNHKQIQPPLCTLMQALYVLASLF